MTKRFLTLFFAISFASICVVQAQWPAPGESPVGLPAKHRTHKKAETTASPGETAASASPAAAPASSPKAKRGRKKAEAGPAASPAAVSGAAAKNTRATAAATAPAPGGGDGPVWVNSDSHVYHRAGSRFYGTTKKGKYMTEAEAVKEGNKAAGKGE